MVVGATLRWIFQRGDFLVQVQDRGDGHYTHSLFWRIEKSEVTHADMNRRT